MIGSGWDYYNDDSGDAVVVMLVVIQQKHVFSIANLVLSRHSFCFQFDLISDL